MDKGALKAAFAWQGCRCFSQMPFAGDVGVVAPVFEQACKGNDAVIEYAFVAGFAFVRCRGGLRHIAYAVAVVVNASQ